LSAVSLSAWTARRGGMLANVQWFGYQPHAINLVTRSFEAGNLHVCFSDVQEFTVHVTVPADGVRSWFMCEGSHDGSRRPVASVAAVVKGVQAVSRIDFVDLDHVAL